MNTISRIWNEDFDIHVGKQSQMGCVITKIIDANEGYSGGNAYINYPCFLLYAGEKMIRTIYSPKMNVDYD
jgi:hypothetical protein